jgi:hypothetical protein
VFVFLRLLQSAHRRRLKQSQVSSQATLTGRMF